MPKTSYEDFASTEARRRLLCEEEAIIAVTELLCREIERKQLARHELAELMGVTRSRVSQILDGEANLTIRSVASVLFALGSALEVSARGLNDPASRCYWVHGNMDGAWTSAPPHGTTAQVPPTTGCELAA